jgi:YidC/Oxa1 family membrane protein insertase
MPALPVANIFAPLNDIEEWVLERLHGIGLGWGLAIVGLTLLIRLSTLPLILRQFRSQRELRKHAPELKKLREEHKDDPKAAQQKTMEYYREHKINPLTALGPLLIQIPVFISLYLLLRSDATSGLFGDSGFLFIPDLTAKPHGAVLVAMITVYLCSQVTSSAIATRAMKGGSRNIALALPVLFVTVIARFPAGLAIYSITTSFWSLGQQICFWRSAKADGGDATGAEALAPMI